MWITDDESSAKICKTCQHVIWRARVLQHLRRLQRLGNVGGAQVQRLPGQPANQARVNQFSKPTSFVSQSPLQKWDADAVWGVPEKVVILWSSSGFSKWSKSSGFCSSCWAWPWSVLTCWPTPTRTCQSSPASQLPSPSWGLAPWQRPPPSTSATCWWSPASLHPLYPRWAWSSKSITYCRCDNSCSRRCKYYSRCTITINLTKVIWWEWQKFLSFEIDGNWQKQKFTRCTFAFEALLIISSSHPKVSSVVLVVHASILLYSHTSPICGLSSSCKGRTMHEVDILRQLLFKQLFSSSFLYSHS